MKRGRRVWQRPVQEKSGFGRPPVTCDTLSMRRHLRPLLLGLAFGGAGLLVNAFPIEVLPAVHVLVGPLFVIFAAVIGGPVAGFTAGLISGFPTLLLWGHPWAWFGFALEGLTVGALRGRMRPVLADTIYWCFGVPYLYVSYVFIVKFPLASFPAVAVKQPLNGLLAALVVQGVMLLPSLRTRLRDFLPRPILDYPVRSAFSAAVALVAVLPLLVLGVLEGRERYRRETARVENENLSTARTVTLVLEERLRAAQRAVQLAAGTVDDRIDEEGKMPSQAELEELLDRLVTVSPYLVNAYVGNAEGRALAFSPRQGPKGTPLVGSDFGDREYVARARASEASFVSGVFQGRGGVEGPLVVTVAPIWHEGKPRGYVLGALDLQVLEELVSGVGLPDQRVRVIDALGNVVVGEGSPDGDAQPAPRRAVESVVGTPLGGALERTPVGAQGSYTTAGGALIAEREQRTWRFTTAGVDVVPWRVVVEQPEVRLAQLVEMSYARLLLGGLFALACLMGLVAALTPVLVTPLRVVSAAAARLAVGEERVRVGARVDAAALELRELGRSFDHMAVELEQRLSTIEAQSRAKDEFLTIASHELKTPITAIKAQLQLLQRLGRTPDPERLETLTRQLDRLSRLVDQLLDASQLGSGRLPLERHPVELSTVVTRVAEAVVLPSAHHSLRLDVAPVEGQWDELRLEQVVHNLVANAVKYSPAGGEIAVTLRREANEARLTVADRGVGLGGSDPDSLFGRFSRGSVRGIRQIAGLGVGLYISREIVRLHGGTIRLRPREGGGTEAEVLLPLEGEDAATSRPSPAPSPTGP